MSTIKTKGHSKKNLDLKEVFASYEDKISSQEKEIFDLEQILEISQSLNSVLNFDRLIEAILYGVMAQLKTLEAAIFTKKNFEDDVFVLNRNYYGFDIDHNISYSINSDHQMIKILEKEKYGLCRNEMRAKLKYDEITESILKMNPSFFALLKAKDKIIGLLVLGKRIDNEYCFSKYEKKIIVNIASLAAIAINNSLLFEMTTIDIMTNLKLKHYFYTILTEKLEAMKNTECCKSFLSILMMDIDFFKNVNDTYGHAAGDFVLKEVAKIIKQCTRPEDLAARYGGEEFVVLLDNTDTQKAFEIAERIRMEIDQKDISYDGKTIRIQISIGISSYMDDSECPKDLVDRADKALYESKQNGRNMITVSKKNLP